MENTKFNLSEKTEIRNKGKSYDITVIRKEVVKEFIRLLKEEVDDKDWFTAKDISCFHSIIDKLSGDKFT